MFSWRSADEESLKSCLLSYSSTNGLYIFLNNSNCPSTIFFTWGRHPKIIIKKKWLKNWWNNFLKLTLFLSSAKSIRKSPIYERLHIFAYKSLCIRMNTKVCQWKYVILANFNNKKGSKTSVNFDGKSRSAAEEAALKLTKLTFSMSMLSTIIRT